MLNLNSTDTLIVSDWHLGFPGTQIKKINLFLDELLQIQPFNKLILNGDIFDLNWQPYEKIITTSNEILKKLVAINQRGVKIIYTLGNHDPLNPKQINFLHETFSAIGLNNIRILPAYQLNRNGFSFLVNHGHMFDTFIAEHKLASAWSDIGYRVTIAFDNFLGIGLTENIVRIFRRYTSWSMLFERRCRRFLRKRKYHGLILGHTHEPKILEWTLKQKKPLPIPINLMDVTQYLSSKNRPKEKVTKFFYNSGDWIEPGHCSYLKIDEFGKVNLQYFR